MLAHWRKPEVITQNYLAFAKLMHVVAGLEAWQTLTTLDFDLAVLTGKRPRRWTFWIYLACRISVIGIIVNALTILNATHELNCQAGTISLLTFEAIAWETSLLLTAVRLVAIWDQYLPILGLAAISWLSSLAISVYTFSQVRLKWGVEFPELGTPPECYISSLPTLVPISVTILAVHVILLSAMIVGLHHRPHTKNFGIWRVLYNQGLMWLVLAIVVEILTLVLLSMNLNNVMNIMLQSPRVIIMTTAATTVYRELQEYGSVSEYRSDGVTCDWNSVDGS